MSRARIVVVGGGFAGASFARAFSRRYADRAEVTLIARENFLLFYPLLVEAGTGNLEPRHVVASLRTLLPHTRLIMGEVTEADCAGGRIAYRAEGASEVKHLEFDHLVLAMGSSTRRPPIPGLDHAYELKTVADAVGLRDRAIRMLEIASALDDREEKRAALHFVIVGGSFTGTELAGEFHAYLQNASRQYKGVEARNCQVTLVELGKRILPALSEDLSAHAHKKLAGRGVRVLTRTGLESVEPDAVTLTDGSKLPAHTTVWCAGVAPPVLNEHLGVPTDEGGWIACDEDLRVKGMENVWAIGDCASNLDADGKLYPATAQHAVRQGEWLARNIGDVLRGRRARPCRIKPVGSIAPLGCRSAVAEVFGLKISGRIAWWLFRTVYLLKMPGLGRKARVAIDWTLDLVFPPDIVQMGIAARSRPDAE